MKKSAHSSKSRKKVTRPRSSPEGAAPPEEVFANPPDEENLAGENFAVMGREDEAASSGHRVEPIKIDPEEDNAEKLIEEGLHGYMRESLKKTRERR